MSEEDKVRKDTAAALDEIIGTDVMSQEVALLRIIAINGARAVAALEAIESLLTPNPD